MTVITAVGAYDDDGSDKEQTTMVQGRKGWTMKASQDEIDLMLRLGVIEYSHVSSGPGFETTFYYQTGWRPPAD